MSETNPPAPKEAQWEALKSQRPRLIIEVGSGATGAAVVSPVLRREFTNGTFQDCRFLCIDPSSEVLINSVRPYSLGWVKSITDQEVLQRFSNQAEEVWLRNTGSIVSKQDWYRTIYLLLQPNGRAIIFDNYTSGLFMREKDQYPQMLQKIGFSVHDWSADFPNSTIAKHPFVEYGLKFTLPTDKPVVVELTKT